MGAQRIVWESDKIFLWMSPVGTQTIKYKRITKEDVTDVGQTPKGNTLPGRLEPVFKMQKTNKNEKAS